MAIKVYLAALTITGGIVYASWKIYSHLTRVRILSKKELSQSSWVPVGTVTNLWLFPVKSCAPLDLLEALAGTRGLVDPVSGVRDRSYMIIKSNSSHMVTGRTSPRLVLIQPSVADNGDLTLSYEGMEDITITPEDRKEHIQKSSSIFGDHVRGTDCGDKVSAWLKRILNFDARLLYCECNTTDRIVRPGIPGEYPLLKKERDAPLYGDGMSYLMLSNPSVDHLKKLTRETLTPLRFRPNIVVGSFPSEKRCKPMKPFEEDTFDYLRIGANAIFRNAFPCSRCIFTCINPLTGRPDRNSDTLNLLKTHRSDKYGVPVLGVNIGVEVHGTINVGDTIFKRV